MFSGKSVASKTSSKLVTSFVLEFFVTTPKTNTVEVREPYFKCFDVLIQYLVPLAISDGFDAEMIFEEVKTTNCFATITEEEFSFCLNFIVSGGDSLTHYDKLKKVVIFQYNKLENKILNSF